MRHFLAQALSDAHGILHMLGLDDHTYTHLSAKVPEEEAFFLTPFGLCFEEVTPDNLLLMGFDGTLKQGQGINQTGYVIHKGLYENNSHIQAVFHLHTPDTIAVSVLEEGLLPLSQWALHFYNRISYYPYASLALEDDQGHRLAQCLGENNILFLRHHGIITVGKTVHEALFYAYHLQKACETQCKLLGMNRQIIELTADVCQKTVQDLLSFEKDLGHRDWQAWLRRLHRYRHKDTL